MLETLYALKAKYERECLVAEAKVSVVNDLIAIEEAKAKVANEEVATDEVVEENIIEEENF
jgi:hypothetical protein